VTSPLGDPGRVAAASDGTEAVVHEPIQRDAETAGQAVPTHRARTRRPEPIRRIALSPISHKMD